MGRSPVELPGLSYRVKVHGDGYWRYEFAGEEIKENWEEWARRILGESGDWLDFLDPSNGRYRGARIVDGLLQGCLFIDEQGVLPSHEWVAGLFGTHSLEPMDRNNILAGKPVDGTQDQGKTVCACFNVGERTLVDAIKSHKLVTIEAIGKALRAGTNCCSCIPEIKGLIASS